MSAFIMQYFETTIEIDGEDIPVTVEYDYTPAEPMSRDIENPPLPAEICICAVTDEFGEEYLDDLETDQIDKLETEIFEHYD